MLKIRRHDCQHLRLDANEGVFFSRQLEYVQQQIYKILYTELSAFRLFPISGEAGPGAKTITYRVYDETGAARIVSGYADDLPRVGLKGTEVTSNVRSIGASYGWSLQDIRSAMLAGVNLSNELAMVAVRAHNRLTNDIAWNGDSQHKLDGLKSLATAGTISQDAAATGAWGTATDTQMIDDVNALITEVITDSKGLFTPNVVAMPPAKYAQIASKRVTNTSVTVLAFLKNVWPGVSWETATELIDWSGSDDAMMAYLRDPSVLSLQIPQPYEELPVQQDNLEFKVPTHSRVGGVIVYQPLAVNFKIGI